MIRWHGVHYDLGWIQNHWRLMLIQTNPFDGESEVELYREDSVVGKSMYLWDLHTPRTKVRILENNERVANGFAGISGCTRMGYDEVILSS